MSYDQTLCARLQHIQGPPAEGLCVRRILMAESASDSEVFWTLPETGSIIPFGTFHVLHSLVKKIRQGQDRNLLRHLLRGFHRCLRRVPRLAANPRILHTPPPHQPRLFGRGVARRRTNLQALCHVAWPRLLQRKHVFSRDQRFDGLPRSRRRAAQEKEIFAVRHPSSSPITSSALALSTCRVKNTKG